MGDPEKKRLSVSLEDGAEIMTPKAERKLTGTEPVIIELQPNSVLKSSGSKTPTSAHRRGSSTRKASMSEGSKRVTTKQEAEDRDAVKAILERAHTDRRNRKHGRFYRLFWWRPSLMMLPPLPFILLALLVFAAATCVFIWARDVVSGGQNIEIWRILLFVFIMIGITVRYALVMAALIFGAELPVCIALWVVLFRFAYRYVLKEPWEGAWWWIKFSSSAIFIMAILTCFLLLIEKSIIISLNRSSLWEKIRSSIFSEAVLQRLYTKMKKGKPPSRKLHKAPSNNFLGAQLFTHTPDFYTFTRLQNIVSQTEYVSLNSAEEAAEEVTTKAEAKELAEQIFTWMDVDKRGWLDITDFFNVFPPDDVGDSFALFDNKTGRVTKDDFVSGVQNIYRARKNLARAVRDRDKLELTTVFSIAGILSRVFVAIFWLISIVIVLILLDVPAAAFLPFATFVLSFSFAFGSTLKSILESLIMIFIEKPFDAGDRILVNGTDFYIVSKMHLLTTEAHGADGRLHYIPNAILSTVRIANYQRSKPWSGLITIELPYSASAGQLHSLTAAIRDYCLRESTSFDTPSLFINDVTTLNRLKLNLWLPVKGVWTDTGRVNDIITELHYFIHAKVKELGIEYVNVTQPVRLHKGERHEKAMDVTSATRPHGVKFADSMEDSRRTIHNF